MSAVLGIRPAGAGDLPAIGEIYNYYVARSTCTFDTDPKTDQQWTDWLAHHQGIHPVIVAERGGSIVGWASLSAWSDRCAYRTSVEDSVYIRHDCHRQGIGAALLRELIAVARRLGHRTILARIAADQPASEAIHEAFGFRKVGHLEKVGHKFDRWLDVAIWQLMLER